MFCGICLLALLVMGLFGLSVPLLNSASTVGNVAGVFLTFGLFYGIVAVVQTTARKYKEASE